MKEMKRRRKPKGRIGKPNRRDLIKVADKLVSEIVRERDGNKCQRCGRPGNNAHHIFSRKYLQTRHVLENLILLCFACHIHVAHGEPEKFRDFIIQRIGQSEFDRLKMSAYMTGCKVDMEMVIVVLRAGNNMRLRALRK